MFLADYSPDNIPFEIDDADVREGRVVYWSREGWTLYPRGYKKSLGKNRCRACFGPLWIEDSFKVGERCTYGIAMEPHKRGCRTRTRND